MRKAIEVGTIDLDDVRQFGSDISERRILQMKREATLNKPVARKHERKDNRSHILGGGAAAIPTISSIVNQPEHMVVDVPSINASSGEKIECLNGHLEINDVNEEADLLLNMELKKYSYRAMHQSLAIVSEYFDDRIESYAELVEKVLGVPAAEFGNPAAPTQDDIVVVGRIASDSLTGGRINSSSLLLEAGRSLGNGARVPLRINGLSSYSFFPGQIVAFRGTNAGGGYFNVREILEVPQPAFASSVCKPLRVVIASGPYTLATDLNYTPLTTLVDIIEREKIKTAVLMGPFIDLRHPLIAAGKVPGDGDVYDLFRDRIGKQLERLSGKCRIIMIPHVADAISHQPNWPQEPFSRAGTGLSSVSAIKMALMQNTNFVYIYSL